MRIGWIGPGITGRPVAGHPIRAREEVHLASGSGVPPHPAEAGGTPHRTARRVAEAAGVAKRIVVALTIEAVAGGPPFAAKAGADPAKVRKVLMGGFAGSKVPEAHGERAITRRFEPGFRIDLHRGDPELALRAARERGVALPAAALPRACLGACRARGDGGRDHAGTVRAPEARADHEPAPEARAAGEARRRDPA